MSDKTAHSRNSQRRTRAKARAARAARAARTDSRLIMATVLLEVEDHVDSADTEDTIRCLFEDFAPEVGVLAVSSVEVKALRA